MGPVIHFRGEGGYKIAGPESFAPPPPPLRDRVKRFVTP